MAAISQKAALLGWLVQEFCHGPCVDGRGRASTRAGKGGRLSVRIATPPQARIPWPLFGQRNALWRPRCIFRVQSAVGDDSRTREQLF